jgi:hypothetical protein
MDEDFHYKIRVVIFVNPNEIISRPYSTPLLRAIQPFSINSLVFFIEIRYFELRSLNSEVQNWEFKILPQEVFYGEGFGSGFGWGKWRSCRGSKLFASRI